MEFTLRRKAAVGRLAVAAVCGMLALASAVRAVRGLIRLSTLDLCGEPGEKLLELLHRKVALLGDAGVAVHVLEGGLTRFGGAG